MKKISFLLAVSALLIFASCKNKPAESTAETTPAPAATKTPAGPTVPFKLVMVKHSVKDFSQWKTVYDAADSIRKAYGMSRLDIARGIPDSNTVYVFEIISDLDKARAFATSADLKAAMAKAGVIGMPQVNYLDVIRDDESPISTKDRLLVMHKVRDFNVWLKAYDAEGKDTRASYGLVDRGLARDLIDSNMVYIEFAVTDMAKAKARGSSPELKKIMQDAGVIGQPVMLTYKNGQ